MVNDIIEELMDPDMDPKPESLWWTSTCKDEIERTLKIECKGKSWDLPFVQVFDLLENRFRRTGMGFEGTENAWEV